MHVTKDVFDEEETHVRTCGRNTKAFPIKIELHQEFALSLYAFSLVIDELTKYI